MPEIVEAPARPAGNRLPLVLAIAGLLLGGGVALDMDRVAAARNMLDRLAAAAAIEAAAAPRAVDREHICRKRFSRHMWTDRDVSLDGVSVQLDVVEGERYSSVAWDATVKLMVGRYFGLPEIEIAGEAEVPAPAAGERVALVSP
jgi:uncharacterized membrane protein